MVKRSVKEILDNLLAETRFEFAVLHYSDGCGYVQCAKFGAVNVVATKDGNIEVVVDKPCSRIGDNDLLINQLFAFFALKYPEYKGHVGMGFHSQKGVITLKVPEKAKINNIVRILRESFDDKIDGYCWKTEYLELVAKRILNS